MADDIRTRLGRRIQGMRLKRGMSQALLADLSDLNRINLSRIESGKAAITIRTLHRIAQALGVTLADLLEGLD